MSVWIVGVSAVLLDVAQGAVFPCNIPGWFTPVIGFAFFFSSLLFLVLVTRKGLRLLSLIPLAISALMAMPWMLSHMCG